jgi:hypothetical protein
MLAWLSVAPCGISFLASGYRIGRRVAERERGKYGFITGLAHARFSKCLSDATNGKQRVQRME